jgi:hypothetical protein
MAVAGNYVTPTLVSLGTAGVYGGGGSGSTVWAAKGAVFTVNPDGSYAGNPYFDLDQGDAFGITINASLFTAGQVLDAELTVYTQKGVLVMTVPFSILQDNVTDPTYTITGYISGTATQALEPGFYKYIVIVTHASGYSDTVVNAAFRLTMP